MTAGLAPHWLVLEVTESVLDLAHDVRTRLEELRAWGVGLSIDDFGTGYSSLARVGELPVRELKIDRSLLAGDQRMLVAVLQFGTSLGLRVVMEGVETHTPARHGAAARVQRPPRASCWRRRCPPAASARGWPGPRSSRAPQSPDAPRARDLTRPAAHRAGRAARAVAADPAPGRRPAGMLS